MDEVRRRLLEGRIIAIVRGVPYDDILPLAQALSAGGVRAVEVTFNQSRPDTWKDTLSSIERIAAKLGGDVLPGAGTVLTPEQAVMAHNAGARYIISPDVNEAVIACAKRLGMIAIPGALTPSEITRAARAGGDIIKLFPAGNMGPEYFKSLNAPLSHIPMFAVGGINISNAAAFIKAGALGLGIGGALANAQLVRERRFDELAGIARNFADVVNTAAAEKAI